jgi:hypothetical protein
VLHVPRGTSIIIYLSPKTLKAEQVYGWENHFHFHWRLSEVAGKITELNDAFSSEPWNSP